MSTPAAQAAKAVAVKAIKKTETTVKKMARKAGSRGRSGPPLSRREAWLARIRDRRAEGLPAFRLGEKKVYLPNHVITFLRRPREPANLATFRVPLRFTKFDIRDYLWNLYGVEATHVRSVVRQQPLARKPLRPSQVYRPQSIKEMTVGLVRPFEWPAVPSGTDALAPWDKPMWNAREAARREAMRAQEDQQRGIVRMRGPWGHVGEGSRWVPLAVRHRLAGERAAEDPSGDVNPGDGTARQKRRPDDPIATVRFERGRLRDMARALLSGEVRWENKMALDKKWETKGPKKTAALAFAAAGAKKWASKSKEQGKQGRLA